MVLCEDCKDWCPFSDDDVRFGFGECGCEKIVDDKSPQGLCSFDISEVGKDAVVIKTKGEQEFITGSKFGCVHGVSKSKRVFGVGLSVKDFLEK